jgi:hypothetical protein
MRKPTCPQTERGRFFNFAIIISVPTTWFALATARLKSPMPVEALSGRVPAYPFRQFVAFVLPKPVLDIFARFVRSMGPLIKASGSGICSNGCWTSNLTPKTAYPLLFHVTLAPSLILFPAPRFVPVQCFSHHAPHCPYDVLQKIARLLRRN